MASTISKMGSETPIEKNGKREKASFDLGKRKVKESELEEAKKERDALRHQRKREIERDRRIEVAGNKKAKLTRDLDRDVSEKIALGQAQPSSRDTMFDARLYNQTAGLDSVSIYIYYIISVYEYFRDLDMMKIINYMINHYLGTDQKFPFTGTSERPRMKYIIQQLILT